LAKVLEVVVNDLYLKAIGLACCMAW